MPRNVGYVHSESVDAVLVMDSSKVVLVSAFVIREL